MRLCHQLEGIEIDLRVTSDFRRTIETAEIALSGRAVPSIVNPCFDDIRYGAFEGKALSRYEEWQQTHPMTEAPPGAPESRVDAVAKYGHGLRMVLGRKERTILLVIHEFPLACIVEAVRGEAPKDHVEHYPYATPYCLGEPEVRTALKVLERWVGERRKHRSPIAP